MTLPQPLDRGGHHLRPVAIDARDQSGQRVRTVRQRLKDRGLLWSERLIFHQRVPPGRVSRFYRHRPVPSVLRFR
jgi:hypothetical protein